MTEHDRRNWLAILWGFAVAGLSILGLAWGVHLWAAGEHDRLIARMILAGTVASVLFSAMATGELIWRLRRGAQEPGRHSKSS